jgi:hypothetical protein
MNEHSSRLVFYLVARPVRWAANIGCVAGFAVTLSAIWIFGLPSFRVAFPDSIVPIIIALAGTAAISLFFVLCFSGFNCRFVIDDDGIVESSPGFAPRSLAWNRIERLEEKSLFQTFVLRGQSGDRAVQIPGIAADYAKIVEQVMRRCPDAIGKLAGPKTELEVPLVVESKHHPRGIIWVLCSLGVNFVIWLFISPKIAFVCLLALFICIPVMLVAAALEWYTLVLTRDRLTLKSLFHEREIFYWEIEDVAAFAPRLEGSSPPVGPFMILALQLRTQETLVHLPFPFPVSVLHMQSFLRSLVSESDGCEENVIDLQAGWREICDRIANEIPFTKGEKELAAGEIDRIREANAKRLRVQ